MRGASKPPLLPFFVPRTPRTTIYGLQYCPVSPTFPCHALQPFFFFEGKVGAPCVSEKHHKVDANNSSPKQGRTFRREETPNPKTMKKHFQQRMSWLPQRWRTQRNAIRHANCEIQWVIKTLNASCTSFGEYVCWSVCSSPPNPIKAIRNAGHLIKRCEWRCNN